MQKKAIEDSKIVIDDTFQGYSGFFRIPTANKSQNNIFTLYQPPMNFEKPDAPVLLWMQGGPGGPGTFGAYAEIGRWQINKHIEPKENYYSWCKEYHCIFVDQPVMTGFSFQTDQSGKVKDEKDIEQTKTSPEATGYILQLLLQFYQIFDLQKREFQIAGESYGGQQTGSMGISITEYNSKVKDDKKINLKGILLGDPVLDSTKQFLTYANTLQGMGLIMEYERLQIESIMQKAVKEINNNNCAKAFKQWNSVWNDNGGGGAPGLFYSMTGCSATMFSAVCVPNPSFDYMVTYLKQVKVMKAMHFQGVKSPSFDEGGDVQQSMVDSGDFCNDSTKYQAELFQKHNLEITIYSSNMDPLLGPPTTETGISSIFDKIAAMDGGIKVADEWNSTLKKMWSTDDKLGVAGYSKCIKGGDDNRFCQVTVRNAGHMTPSQQPRSSQDMFMRYMTRDKYEGLPTKFEVDIAEPQCAGTNPFAGEEIDKC